MIGSPRSPSPPSPSVFFQFDNSSRKLSRAILTSSNIPDKLITPIRPPSVESVYDGFNVSYPNSPTSPVFFNPFFVETFVDTGFDSLFKNNDQIIDTHQVVLKKSIKSRLDALLSLDTKLIQRSSDKGDLLMECFGSALGLVPIVGKAATAITKIGSYLYDKRVERLWEKTLRNIKVSSLSTDEISHQISLAWTTHYSSNIIESINHFKKTQNSTEIIDKLNDASDHISKLITLILSKFDVSHDLPYFLSSYLLRNYQVDKNLWPIISNSKSKKTLFDSTQFRSQIQSPISGKPVCTIVN